MGPELGFGVWCRFEFDDDVRAWLRATVRDWNDLSINVFELLGMVVAAWISSRSGTRGLVTHGIPF